MDRVGLSVSTPLSEVANVPATQFEHGQAELNQSLPSSKVALVSDKPLLVSDWEKGSEGYWRTLDVNGIERRYTREQMLEGAVWKDVAPCVLIIESAHLSERRPQSLSQVYYAHEHHRLYEAAKRDGVIILAFPEEFTERARREFGFKKANGKDDKTKDPVAIRLYLEAHPEWLRHLKKWRPISDDKRALYERVGAMRADASYRLNEMRAGDEKYVGPEVEHTRAILIAHLNDHGEEACDFFKIWRYKVNSGDNKKGDLRETTISWPQVMAIYVCVFNEDGSLRRNPDGDFIGVNFIRDQLLLQSPYHRRSGTARSNLMWHGLRNYEPKCVEEGMTVQQARSRYRKAVKELIKLFRDTEVVRVPDIE